METKFLKSTTNRVCLFLLIIGLGVCFYINSERKEVNLMTDSHMQNVSTISFYMGCMEATNKKDYCKYLTAGFDSVKFVSDFKQIDEK